MNIKERAKQFAIMAHKNQVRKNEPDKPMIMHPISVAKILEDYGYHNNIVAAGYLHDVVEDTKYTLEDIKSTFGSDIANLVKGASEPDKSLSWKERKQHTIDQTRTLPLDNKLVICADKISNLEDLNIMFQKSGTRDFSRFKEGEILQKWYYTGVYESIIFEQDNNLPIFKRLKKALDNVFYDKENELLTEIFLEEATYYQTLKALHAQKMELQKLKEICDLPKPFVIEFSGTPRTGKTTIINNLYDFFKKGGFLVDLICEFTTSNAYKKNILPKYKDRTKKELNITILKEVEKQLRQAVSNQNDVILIDRSLNDRAIWNHIRFECKDLLEEEYKEITQYYTAVSKELIDMLVIAHTDAKTSLKRDYINHLAIENRRFLNEENITRYNQSMEYVMPVLEQSVDQIQKVDTTNITPRDASVLIAKNIMEFMREKYINAFKKSIED